MRITSYMLVRVGSTRHTTVAYDGHIADAPSSSPPAIPGLAQVIDEAHGRVPDATVRLANARTVEQLHRLRMASAEAVVEAEGIRRRAASRERSALQRAAILAGFSEQEAQRRLVTAGTAAR